MRIITGSAKGINLQTPAGTETRPTAARVKEALFSMLQFDIEGRRVLDLFGGSGQLGLEALSRDAAFCTFVDASAAAMTAIRKNIEKTGFADRTETRNVDYRSFLRRGTADGYDLVFLDPPYASDALADALILLGDSGFLQRGCILACESENGSVMERDARIAARYTLLKGSRYGRVHIELLSPILTDSVPRV